MRALPVQPEPLWLTDFRQRIAVSLWFVRNHIRGRLNRRGQPHYLAGR
jgi:hypothetical protein